MELHTHESLCTAQRLYDGARAPFSLGAWLSGLLLRIREAERFRRDYEILMAKSDRELSDIGLTRGDVILGFKRKRTLVPTRRG